MPSSSSDWSEPAPMDRPPDGTAGPATSLKAVVLRELSRGGSQVLLCRNDRDEWELPGGRAEPGESDQEAVRRAVLEQTGQAVEVGELVLQAPLAVRPGRTDEPVRAYRCGVTRRAPLLLSAAHTQLAWLPVEQLPDRLSADYRAAIAAAGSGGHSSPG